MKFKEYLALKNYRFYKKTEDGPMIEMENEIEAGHLDLTLQHERFVRVDSFEMLFQSENPNAYYLNKERGKTLFFFKSDNAKNDALTFKRKE